MAAKAVRAAPTLPHSVEAEQALLGSILIDATAWAQVGATIHGGDFYRLDHRPQAASRVGSGAV